MDYPSLKNLPDIKTITVIPANWIDASREYEYLKDSLTEALVSAVKRADIYEFVDPSILTNVFRSDYWQYVDMYIVSEILNVNENETDEIKKDKDKERVYTTISVDIVIEYRYIRAKDESILRIVNRTISESETFYDTAKTKNSLGKKILYSLLELLVSPRLTAKDVAISAIKHGRFNIAYDLGPYRKMEKRFIKDIRSKNPEFKKAEKLVWRKKYSEALALYRNIYENTHSTVTGYNAALLLMADDQFPQALELLEELQINLLKYGIAVPEEINNEIKKVKYIINNMQIRENSAEHT